MQSKASNTEDSPLAMRIRACSPEKLLEQLRAAIWAQAQFWDITLEIAEALDCEPQLVMECAAESAIMIENPTEVGEAELDDLFAALGRSVNAKGD